MVWGDLWWKESNREKGGEGNGVGRTISKA